MHFVTRLLVQKKALFIIILLLAGVFRVLSMQYIEFKGDEALNLFLATRPIFHHPFPPASQASSAGILNFPLLNYLLFPIVIFTIYPPTVSLVIALLNVLTVGGFFLLFTRYHARLTAFLASCILSLSPWAILYSRKIWAQDFLLPLSLLFFLSMYKILEGRKQYWFLFGASSMFLMQMHQIALLIPLLVFFALSKRAIVSWRILLLGVGVGLLPTIPYFWYMAFHVCFSCQNTMLAARLSFHDAVTFLRPLQIISIGNFHTEFGDDFAKFAMQFPLIYKISKLSYLSYMLLPLGMVFFWIKNNTYRFFVLVCLAYVLLLFIAGIEPLMHYYILLLPFLALFVAYLLSYAIRAKNVRLIGIAITFLYLVSLLLFDYGFLAFLAQKGGLSGDYGGGYTGTEQSANAALKMFKAYPNYSELELLYFSPQGYFHGYMPLGQMIFPYYELQKDEIAREKVFIKTPTNPLLSTEVFAYYTQSKNPSWKTIVALKEKTRIHREYDFIYQKVLNEYESVHFKNLYETPDFLLLYPRHWHTEQIENGIILSDGEIAVTIKKIILPTDVILLNKSAQLTQSSILGQTIQKETCMQQALWCGETYQPILIRAAEYQFLVKLLVLDKNTNGRLRPYAESVLKEIIESIMPLK